MPFEAVDDHKFISHRYGPKSSNSENNIYHNLESTKQLHI